MTTIDFLQGMPNGCSRRGEDKDYDLRSLWMNEDVYMMYLLKWL